jgi:hypothetical protein
VAVPLAPHENDGASKKTRQMHDVIKRARRIIVFYPFPLARFPAYSFYASDVYGIYTKTIY